MPEPLAFTPRPKQRHCRTCGGPVRPTGRPGRPFSTCAACRGGDRPSGAATPPAATTPQPLASLTARAALTVDEAAAAIGVSRPLLYSMWRAGVGPPRIKAGARRVLVPVAGLLAWLEEATR